MDPAADEATSMPVAEDVRGRAVGPRTALGGGVLLLAALAAWLVLGVAQVDGYRWDEHALVPADGSPHEVAVGGSEAMVWAEESVATPTCTASDTASGETLDLEPTDGSYRRGGGKPGDWVGVATLDAPTAGVAVTCTLGEASARSETAGPSGVLVAVEAAPVLPPWLAGLGAWVALPLTLGVAGVAALLAAALARVRRATRPEDRRLRP